jgi:hypothetical protein
MIAIAHHCCHSRHLGDIDQYGDTGRIGVLELVAERKDNVLPFSTAS